MNPSIYLQIARSAIGEYFGLTRVEPDSFIAAYPELRKEKACFVTLNSNHHLRGCIGSIIPHRPLIDDLISNARSAAFKDPRFPPLTREEFSTLTIEVSLLSLPQEVNYRDREELKKIIRPSVDGVILRLGNQQATFLPQVWDELNDFDQFFAHLGLKARIGSDPLSYHPQIYTYQVEKFEENSDEN